MGEQEKRRPLQIVWNRRNRSKQTMWTGGGQKETTRDNSYVLGLMRKEVGVILQIYGGWSSENTRISPWGGHERSTQDLGGPSRGWKLTTQCPEHFQQSYLFWSRRRQGAFKDHICQMAQERTRDMKNRQCSWISLLEVQGRAMKPELEGRRQKGGWGPLSGSPHWEKGRTKARKDDRCCGPRW